MQQLTANIRNIVRLKKEYLSIEFFIMKNYKYHFIVIIKSILECILKIRVSVIRTKVTEIFLS